LSTVISTILFSICNVILGVSDTVGAPALSGEVQTDVSQRKTNHGDIVNFAFKTLTFAFVSVL